MCNFMPKGDELYIYCFFLLGSAMHYLRSILGNVRVGVRNFATAAKPRQTYDFSQMPGFKSYPMLGTLPSMITDKSG